MERTCYVYLYVNQVNGKAYIGKTSNLTLRQYLHRYAANVRNTNTHFYNAIRKYGLDVFRRVIITKTSSDEKAYDYEKLFITEFKRLGFRLYNTTDGGEGLNNPSEETKQKISDGQANRKPWSIEDRSKLSISNMGHRNPMFGRKHSPESIAKNAISNSIAQTGDKNGMYGKRHSNESLRLMREKKLGKVASEETRLLWSSQRKGSGNSFFNKKHSPESIEKIRLAALRRHEMKRIAHANRELAPIDVC